MAALHITLLGPFQVLRARAAQPPSSSERQSEACGRVESTQARLLLAYLLSTGGAHCRTKLSELLFCEAADPHAALSRALDQLRVLVDDGDRARVHADAQTISLDMQDVQVDATRLDQVDLCSAATDALIELAGRCRGSYLEGVALSGAPGAHAFFLAERERLANRQRQLLSTVVERLRGDFARAIPFARQRAELDENDQSAQAELINLLLRADRTREAADQLRTYQESLSRRGHKPERPLLVAQHNVKMQQAARSAEQLRSAETQPSEFVALGPQDEQHVRFCMGGDGARIAYASLGAGPPLLKTANFLNHLEFDWQSPIWRHWLTALSREHTLIRYDERGSGLSEREPLSLSFEALVDDLESVAQAAGLTRYPLFGISQGCAVAIEHAVRHPERVSHLVLFGGYAAGFLHEPDPARQETYQALLARAQHGWGRKHPAFRQAFTTLHFPEATPIEQRDFNDLQRETATPEQAMRLLRAIGSIDVRERLLQVRVPTLVLHCRDDALVSFEHGRTLASGIPGARFVPLESKNHLLLEHEPAFAHLIRELRAFLRT